MKTLSIAVVLFTLLLLSPVIQAESTEVTHINQQELAEKMKESSSVLIDIRTLAEVRRGVIPGSIHVPITEIQRDPSVLDEYLGKDLVFYCHSGVRVNALTEYLQLLDHPSKEKLFHLKGDYSEWTKNGNEIEK